MSIVGSKLYYIFVNINNTIYVADQENSRILVWHENSTNPTNIISGNFTEPISLFVTLNGDIYIDDGGKNGRVQKWTEKTNSFVTVMGVHSSCWGLFVDTNDTLYCSMRFNHQVVKRSLYGSEMTPNIIAAGTGFSGSALNQLNESMGVFVDVNLDLYVADYGNNRVQLFRSGESYGITVAGSRSSNPTINLHGPSCIVLDADKYLFIVDSYNNRIVGSSLNGFRCLIGCYGRGSQVDPLNKPSSVSFDRYGNIFVAHLGNDRIKKFMYRQSCFGKLKGNQMEW